MRPTEIHNKRILISPLNWGWGHVARCVPLIHQLKEQGNVLFVACSSEQRGIFEEYLEEVRYIDHAGYPFKFRGKGAFALDMYRSRKALKKRLFEEVKQVEQYVRDHSIDLVLSDHRYGFHSSVVPSIFITHQINLPLPRWLFVIQNMHERFMRKFTNWWIMDFEENLLAGKLSRSKNSKAIFVGPYSRFMMYDRIEPPKKCEGKVFIASGPEVYAEQFIVQNERMISDSDALVESVGLHSKSWRDFDRKILDAETLVARSGYSTIMDLYFLKKRAELSPTPGQAEQIYLYNLHKESSLVAGEYS